MAEAFGTELRRLRRQGQLTLRSLARRVGVDFTYLSKIETGALPPPAAPTIDKLARALGRSPDTLLRLARKVPSDLSAILLANEHVPVFLRAASRERLSQRDWEELTRWLAERRERPSLAFAGRFSDGFLADRLLERLAIELPSRQLVFAEMCGPHGHKLVRLAVERFLRGRIRVLTFPSSLSGVTEELSSLAGMLARRRDVQFLAFPDLMLAPLLRESALRKARLRIEAVAAPHQAVQRAAENPQRKYVFLAAGFETTVPSVALSAMEAQRQGIGNFFLLTSLRSMIAAIREVARRKGRRINGILAPGHVTAIVGLEPLRRIVREYRVPIIVTGFEIVDILCALLMLIRQVRKRQALAENQYGRVAQEQGNPAARRLLKEVFHSAEGRWTGLGKVPDGVFRLRPEYSHLDAAVLLRRNG